MKCLLNPPKCNCNLWQEAKSLVSRSLFLARSLLADKALARLAGSLPRRSTLSRSGSQIIKNQNHFLSMLTNFLWLDIEQAYVKRKKSREEPAVTCGHRGAKGINEDQVVEGEATMAGVSGNSRFPWFPGIQASNFCSLPVAFCNFPSRSREKEVLAGNWDRKYEPQISLPFP